jgi:hypothetical protein
VLGIAYPANRLDGHGEFMRPESVRKAAQSYIGARIVGLDHVDGTEGCGTVTGTLVWPEEFGVMKVMAANGTEQEIHPGDWLLETEFEPGIWPDIRKGKYTGWSIQGMGARRESEDNP